MKVKHTIIVMCLVIFFFLGVSSVLIQGRKCYRTLKQLKGLSKDQKRFCLIGDVPRFAAKCNKIIPENSNILYLSNVSNNRSSFDLYLNYHIYPRKLYWLNNVAPYPESPLKLKDLDYAFLSKKKIDWLILRYPKEYGINKVIKLNREKAVTSFHLN